MWSAKWGHLPEYQCGTAPYQKADAKADAVDSFSPIAIDVVILRAVRVVSGILATVDLNDMSVWMLSPFYLSHDVATWNVLPVANIVMLIPPSGSVAFPFNPRHNDVLICA